MLCHESLDSGLISSVMNSNLILDAAKRQLMISSLNRVFNRQLIDDLEDYLFILLHLFSLIHNITLQCLLLVHSLLSGIAKFNFSKVRRSIGDDLGNWCRPAEPNREL